MFTRTVDDAIEHYEYPDGLEIEFAYDLCPCPPDPCAEGVALLDPSGRLVLGDEDTAREYKHAQHLKELKEDYKAGLLTREYYEAQLFPCTPPEVENYTAYHCYGHPQYLLVMDPETAADEDARARARGFAYEAAAWAGGEVLVMGVTYPDGETEYTYGIYGDCPDKEAARTWV